MDADFDKEPGARGLPCSTYAPRGVCQASHTFPLCITCKESVCVGGGGGGGSDSM